MMTCSKPKDYRNDFYHPTFSILPQANAFESDRGELSYNSEVKIKEQLHETRRIV
jgi:hypothetical protein